MSKTIWYINHHSGGPGVGSHYRAYELCGAWKDQGHHAHVFHGNYANRGQEVPHPEYQIIDDIPFTGIKTLKYGSNGLKRFLSMLMFGWHLGAIPKNLAEDEPRPDAIIISTGHPFGIFAGKALAQKYRAKLVLEIRDFWPLTFYEVLGMSKLHPFSLLCDFAEKFALKNADLVTSLLPRANLYFEEFNRPVKAFSWTPMGASELQSPENENEISESFKTATKFITEAHRKGKKIIIYAGAMGPANNVELLLSALEYGQNCEIGQQVNLLMVGDGILRPQLEIKATKLSQIEYHFSGMLSKVETQKLLELSDIGYAGGKNLPRLYRYGIAFNKLCSYMDARLVTILPLEPCGDPLSESGCGIVDGTQDSSIIWEHIETLATMNKKQRQQLGEKGYKYLHEVHNLSLIHI